jgi:hypothetical protein
MSDSLKKENRLSARFISKAVIQVHCDEVPPVLGVINNISAGGVSLDLEIENAQRSYQVGHIVLFEMPLKMFGLEKEESLKLKAEIKRVANLGKTISCQFLNLKESEIEILNKGLRIIEFVNKISRKQPLP